MSDTRKYNDYSDADQLTIFESEDNRAKHAVDGFVFKTEEDAVFYKENEMQLIGNIMFFSNTLLWDDNPVVRLLPYFADERFVSLIEQKIKFETKEMIDDCFDQGYTVEEMCSMLEDTIEKSMITLKAIIDSTKVKINSSKINLSENKYNNLSKEAYKKIGSDFVDNYHAMEEEIEKMF